MKIVINDEVCGKFNLTFPEVLALLLVKSCDDIPELFRQLMDKEAIIKDEASLFNDKKLLVTPRWDDLCANVLLTSDSEVPKDERIIALAKELMEIYPKGKKEGTNIYWRGNLKDTTLKLKKFFKLYGNKYSDEEILNATRKYVQSFNGNYSFMRVLKYFIWKAEKKLNSDGEGYIEEVSDLADIIENKDVTTNNNWVNELR